MGAHWMPDKPKIQKQPQLSQRDRYAYGLQSYSPSDSEQSEPIDITHAYGLRNTVCPFEWQAATKNVFTFYALGILTLRVGCPMPHVSCHMPTQPSRILSSF